MIANKIQPQEYVRISKGGGMDGLSLIQLRGTLPGHRLLARWQASRGLLSLRPVWRLASGQRGLWQIQPISLQHQLESFVFLLAPASHRAFGRFHQVARRAIHIFDYQGNEFPKEY